MTIHCSTEDAGVSLEALANLQPVFDTDPKKDREIG
jgi:hypothetical protein